MHLLWELFYTFAKIGLFTFGGGYAMLPMLERELVESKKWTGQEELIDYFAIGQCTPGVIAVNTATFVGYKLKGVSGAIIATAGVIFPSFVIVTIIAAFLSNFQDLVMVQQAFSAIRVTVGVLIFNAVIKLWKTTVKDKLCAVLVIAAFLLSEFLNLSPILIVVVSAVLGIAIPVIRREKNE